MTSYRMTQSERKELEELRGRYDPRAQWYGVRTHLGRERLVRSQIRKTFGLESVGELYLPEGPCADDKPTTLLGGYLFMHCPMSDPIYLHVTALPIVYEIMGRAFRLPSPIPEAEMSLFRRAVESGQLCGWSDGLRVGEMAQVRRGLLKGAQGRIVECNARAVKLSLAFSFLGTQAGLIVAVARQEVVVPDACQRTVKGVECCV